MVYIDMNMVRAGVIGHPAEWPDCGYHEIQNPRQRYLIINRRKLAELTMLEDREILKESHAGWLHDAVQNQVKGREDKWSSSIVVGGEKFVDKIKQLLGVNATGRRVVSKYGTSELREPSSHYQDDFTSESGS